MSTLAPGDLVILGAGQRREHAETEQVDRQLALDDLDIAPDRFRRVGRKAKNIPRIGEDALLAPRQQHLAVFGDLVLLLLRERQVVGVDVLQPDEHAGDAGALRFFDEARNLVAHRIDLDHQADRDLVDLAQLGEPVEDRFPVLVAGEIVVGDEEAGDALRQFSRTTFSSRRRSGSGLAALHVDIVAERSLERTAAPASKLVLVPTVRLAHWRGMTKSACASRQVAQYCKARTALGGVAEESSKVSSASPANIEMPISRHRSSWTALPSSMERQPETWKPPITT